MTQNKVEACTTLMLIAKVLINQNVPLNGDLRKIHVIRPAFVDVVFLVRYVSVFRIRCLKS